MFKLRPIHVLVFVVALVLLGALAWSVGWVAHSLVGGGRAAATATVTATVTGATPTDVPATPAPTPTDVSPAAVTPTSTPQPTSTPMSTLTLPPVEEWETVRQGEGLYQICRRHCPGRWPAYGIPPDLEGYARKVAQLNGLRWPNPVMHKGQKLRMPLCPP